MIQPFVRLQNKFVRNSNRVRKIWERFKVCLPFPVKWFSIRWPGLAFQSLEPIFHGPQDSISAFDRLQNKFLGKTIYEESFWIVSRFASIFQKNSFVFAYQTWHYNAMNQYSIYQKIRLTLLTVIKTNV